eukprot:609884-Pelagomonas_calceolata.AAC.9
MQLPPVLSAPRGLLAVMITHSCLPCSQRGLLAVMITQLPPVLSAWSLGCHDHPQLPPVLSVWSLGCHDHAAASRALSVLPPALSAPRGLLALMIMQLPHIPLAPHTLRFS